MFFSLILEVFKITLSLFFTPMLKGGLQIESDWIIVCMCLLGKLTFLFVEQT